jgi:predicted Zn finger-like uncharacterized protein
MSLSVTCPDCDRTIKVKDEIAGKKVRCPGCSTVISIPAASANDDDFLSDFDDVSTPKRPRRRKSESIDDDEDDLPAVKPRGRKSAKTSKKKSSSKSGGPNWPLIGGLGGGGLVIAVLVAVVIVTMGQARNPANNKALANWITFKHPTGFAQIDMPATPSFKADQSLNGVQTYTLEQRSYQMSLTAVQFDPTVQAAMATNPATLDVMFQELQRQTPLQMPGSTLISSRPLTAGPYRGLEMKIRVNGQINLMRFYATPTALIGAEFVSRQEEAFLAERDKFFSTFRGPDGNLIEGPNPPPGTSAPVVGTPSATPAPTSKPTPPLNLQRPEDPSPMLSGMNLADADPHVLAATANQAANQTRDYVRAAQIQFWVVKRTNDGQYNLACYLSLAGKTDAAFYWLQQAALEEGVDSNWALQDPDLLPLRGNPRWKEVFPFLVSCNAYWSANAATETQLVMPAGVNSTEPIPVMIGLHGMGSSAAGFVDAATYQEIANQKHVAFLGVSGTLPRGPKSFVWSEDVTKDAARIDAALKEVSGRLTPKEGQLVLFGFSQGGMMSAEIAAKFPEKYAGALVMSPGGNSEPQRANFQKRSGGRTQSVVCVCGAGEHPGNVQMTQTYADLFRQAGARVIHKPYPNQNTHSFPPDFETELPSWIDFLLGIL